MKGDILEAVNLVPHFRQCIWKNAIQQPEKGELI